MCDAQVFLPRDYSLNPVDLVPDDDIEDDADVRWLHYCEVAATVDRQHILECVLSDLDADDSPLFEFIDEAIRDPHEPGRARDSVTNLARLGQSLLNLIAKAVDDAVNLRMACQEVRHG